MNARVTRASGAGNTFFIADLLSHQQPALTKLTPEQRKKLVIAACENLGATKTDGFLFLEDSDIPGTDLRWDFYNADGSGAEMCGNAARCVAVFFYQKTQKANLSFATKAGVIRAEALSTDRAKVKMSRLQGPSEKSVMLKDGRRIQGFVVDSGVPHFVTRVPITREIGREIRTHIDFGTAGTNVTEIQSEKETSIVARTYERGVEDFTAACGTGAVAAASVIWNEQRKSPVTVKMPGGSLEVSFFADSPHPVLEGPAILEKTFDLKEEWMENKK